jgi:hypothetical protein
MKLVALAGMTLALSAALGVGLTAREDKARYTIEEVMEKAHKGANLRKQVLDGKASAEQKKELLALYEALARNNPPQGDKAAWKKLTGEIVTAAKGVVAGKAGADKALAKATNCKACHDVFKGE